MLLRNLIPTPNPQRIDGVLQECKAQFTFFEKHNFINFPPTNVRDFNSFCFICLHVVVKIMVQSNVVGGVLVQFSMDMIIVDCPVGMHVHGCMDGIQVPPWNTFNKHYWEYVFSMANDLLDNNKCLVLL